MKTILPLLFLLSAASGGAVDGPTWPTARGTPRRSSSTDIALEFPMELAWRHQPIQGPKPAWPAPARGSYWQNLDRIESRVREDWAFSSVVSQDLVFYASSADDSVRALDLLTGAEQWRFTAEGPIRHAPALDSDSVFFGADDGFVYRLAQSSGSLIWKRRIAPSAERIPGNDRLISPWPIRGGLVLEDGELYGAAGLYPNQGAYLFRLDARTGEIVWNRELEISPQGYLVLSNTSLIVPTGRATPSAYSRSNGDFERGYTGMPGAFAVIAGSQLSMGRGNANQLDSVDVDTGQRLAGFDGVSLAADNRRNYLLDSRRLSALDRESHAQASREIAALRSALGKPDLSSAQKTQVVAALEAARQRQENAMIFHAPIENGQTSIVFQTHVVVGADDAVIALDIDTGKRVWERPVSAPCLDLAATPSGFIAALASGELWRFSTSSPETPIRPTSVGERRSENAHIVGDGVTIQIPESLATLKGYALVADVQDGRLAEALAIETPLNVIAVEKNAKIVEAIRDRWIAMGIYGERAAILHIDEEQLPLTDHFANLLLSETPADERSWELEDLERFLNPYNGQTLDDDALRLRPHDPGSGRGEWTSQYANLANTASSGDQLVGATLALQWFGGPGPHRMIDRHLRGPAPLFSNGILVVFGENKLIGVDGFNGLELWELDLGDSQRYSMPYDAGYASAFEDTLALAVNDELWKIDLQTGARIQTWTAPSSNDGAPLHFGYVGHLGDRIMTSLQTPNASRTQPSRSLIDTDYRSRQPIVCSRSLMAWDESSDQVRWLSERRTILNPTITIHRNRIFFVESDHQAETGRILLNDAMSQNARFVCLDLDSGELLWEREIVAPLDQCENILYGVGAGAGWLVSGSYIGDNNDSIYLQVFLDIHTGESLWKTEHPKGKPGALYHGEQVHHPVIIGDRFVLAEPMLYELKTGKRVLDPTGSDWELTRPGHSCGTISASANAAFFRASSPTVIDLSAPETGSSNEAKTLAPTRPGCWINIIPAGGLALIPEASAGCVCHYSLQTSMAFKPIE